MYSTSFTVNRLLIAVLGSFRLKLIFSVLVTTLNSFRFLILEDYRYIYLSYSPDGIPVISPDEPELLFLLLFSIQPILFLSRS